MYLEKEYPNYCETCEEKCHIFIGIFLFEIHEKEFVISRGLCTTSKTGEKWLQLSKYLPAEAVSSTILGQNDQSFDIFLIRTLHHCTKWAGRCLRAIVLTSLII